MDKDYNQEAPASFIQRYRWMENGHILLWLIKDTCWAMEWREGGLFMIIPTVAVAFYILFRSFPYRSERFHNMAICIWITANSLWMLGEFFGNDFRPVAVGMFSVGLMVLTAYYLFYFRKDRNAPVSDTVTVKKHVSGRLVADELQSND